MSDTSVNNAIPEYHSAASNQYKHDEELKPVGETMRMILLVIGWLFVLITLPLSILCCIKIIQQYEKVVIIRLGGLQKELRGPGLIFINCCTDEVHRLDLRLLPLDVPTQEVLTQDAVSIQVDAVVYYRIEHPILAVLNVQDYHLATYLLAMTFLRDVIGAKSMHDVLDVRQEIQLILQQRLDKATDPWGIIVERVEIKDVRLPVSMQRAMAAEGQAVQDARAKLIHAQGELKAAVALQQASDIIITTPGALQLKYLETLNTISTEQNKLIVFPFPLGLLESISTKK